MVAISTSTVTVPTPSIPPLGLKPAVQESVAAVAANDPVDTVTLSAQAQQVLDGQAPPPPALASVVPTPAPAAAPPSSDQIAAAVAALNDTSGKTALDDQLKAYALISNVVAKGQVLFDNRLPPASPPPGGMIKASDAQALLVSPFSQRLNQVAATVDAKKTSGAGANGDDLANAIDRGLAAFDALSADDQKIYVAAKNVYNGLVAQQPPVASVADYRASQQAQADADRAQQAAGQTVPQGEGAAGPPPGYKPPDIKALMDALAKVDDTSGGVMATDQVAALKLLQGYAAGAGPAGAAIALNATASPFAAHVAQTQTLVNDYLVPGKDPYPQILDHLNRLSPEDQSTYFGTSNTAPDGTVLFGSLDSLKQNLTTRETMLQLYTAVTKAYGVQDLAHLTTRAAKDNPALQQLEKIFRADQGNDDWTAMAQDFLDHTTPADLGLAPVDQNGDPDMAKALKTLAEVEANQTAFVVAVKTGHMQDWRAVTEAKKAAAKAQANDAAKALTARAAA